MTVDFRFRKAPKYQVATYRWKGPWSEAKIRSNFRMLAAWAKRQRVPTGVWIFREPGEREWEVSIELRAPASSSGDVRVRTLPASRVASVQFDPNVVSPRVVYHGVSDWLRWRRKEGEIKRVGSYREVYRGDPWADARAWADTEIQVEVR